MHICFCGCRLLQEAPEVLPATTLAQSCYNQMFNGCEELVNAPVISATVAASQSCYSMFASCYSLKNVPDLNLTTLDSQCCYSMFSSCGSLEEAPYLPATTTAASCYAGMFQSCTNLRKVKVGLTSWGNGTSNWLQNVPAGGTFICHNTLPTTPRDASHIPATWNVQYIEP